LAGGQHTNPTIADSSWGSTWHFKFQPGLEEPEAGLLGEGKQFKRISRLPRKKSKKFKNSPPSKNDRSVGTNTSLTKETPRFNSLPLPPLILRPTSSFELMLHSDNSCHIHDSFWRGKKRLLTQIQREILLMATNMPKIYFPRQRSNVTSCTGFAFKVKESDSVENFPCGLYHRCT
jgi:hypothetical protein